MERRTVRASTLPRLATCPASYAESLGKVNPSNPAAALGSAFHAAMYRAAQAGRQEVDLERIATEHGAPLEELSRLWRDFDFDPSRGVAEKAISFGDERVEITGRLDYLEVLEPGTASLVDWKTTHRIEEDPEPWNDPQTKAYAVGVLLEDDSLETVRTQKAYVRRGENGWSQPFTMTREMLDFEERELLDIAAAAVGQIEKAQDDRRYVLSHHCDYCPGRTTCPAVRREVTAALSALREVAPRVAPSVDLVLTVETLPKWHEVVRLLTRAKNALHERIKEAVDALGPVEVEPGKFLAVKRAMRRVPLTEKLIREAARAADIDDGKVEDMLELLSERERRPEARLDIFTEASLSRDS